MPYYAAMMLKRELLTQQELAGTSRESVNRASVWLRRQGKVRLDGGWIVLLNGKLEK